MKKKPEILIIDDEADICEILQLTLEEDFKIETCTDPVSALKKIETKNYDLIVTDYTMPNVSGLQIVLRSEMHQPNTPVVIISGNSKMCEDLKHRVEDVIVKPFDLSSISQKLKKYVTGGINVNNKNNK